MGRILLIIGILSMGMLVAGLAVSEDDDYSQPYDVLREGKAAFYTDQDYSSFKTLMARDDVDIKAWVTHESPAPVVVEFQVRVPHDLEFRYGYVVEDYVNHRTDWVGCGIFLAGLVGLFIAIVAGALLATKDIKAYQSVQD